MKTILTLLCAAFLVGCASRPSNIEDSCLIFQENGGWFNNWYRQASKAEKEFGVPVPTLMATIWKESAFHGRARPPRRQLLGFIPWKRPSNAYGYAQALKGTWREYQHDTGRHGADRNDFGDAVHFVGWYYHRSHVRNGIRRDDPYNLYLSYYAGHGGYARGTWKNNTHMKTAAARVASMDKVYRRQLANCKL